MPLWIRGHKFQLPTIKYEFNKCNFNYLWLCNYITGQCGDFVNSNATCDFLRYCGLVCIMFTVYTCATVICNKLLLTYLLTGSYPAGDLLSHAPYGKLPLLSARPAVTFPAKERHRPSTNTKLYCSVTEAHRCEQLAQGCYASCLWWNSNPQPKWSQVQRCTAKPLFHLIYCFCM